MTTEDAARPGTVNAGNPAPSCSGSEADEIAALVQHRHAVDHLTTLEEIHRLFRERKTDFFAVTREGRVMGLCARSQVGFIMGSRFGFALYSQSSAHTALVDNPIIVTAATPAPELLALAFARKGDDFYEDIVLVDDDGQLIGLIGTEPLVKLQTRLMAGQMQRLQSQHGELHTQNLDLFRTNHALRQSRGLYQGLFESNVLGVALLDPAGNIQGHNRRFADLFGLGGDSKVAGSFAAWVSEREREAFRQLLAAHEHGGLEATGMAPRELTLHPPGNGPRRFRLTAGWIAETGQVCVCLDDVTEQRALEQHMARREKQNLLDTLVGGIAHELNNKLTPVLGFAELLEAQAGPDTAASVAGIRQSAVEAAGIIRQLLQFSKPAPGHFRRTDLRAVVEDSLLMLRFQAREARCTVTTVLPPGPVPVRGDAQQLKQVVMNLILNALQAAADGPDPRVEARVAVCGDQGCVVVSDNGPGIAPEHLGRVFDPFFTTKGPDKGTGLGLSICQSLVRQHDGDLAAENLSGGGARFTVSLPLDSTTGEVLFLDAPPLPRPDSRSPATSPVSARAHVLVVEDEEIVRSVLQEIFRRSLGCRVTLAANGEEALAALANGADYDLVLSDIRMPVMSGTELYARLRETHPALARRFVFVTGHPGGKDLEDEIARWGRPVLGKPFIVERLREVCGPFLARSAVPVSAPAAVGA
jgi:signal transduction histidine kinase